MHRSDLRIGRSETRFREGPWLKWFHKFIPALWAVLFF
mgnify:CR=1 FL=1